ncbi:MAG TPA: hypothetical protein VG387_20025 [Rhizomicrobium sp.]|jgi:hypothetical protein|nr:hypothetical protein [Rhizomicrobium sp.]
MTLGKDTISLISILLNMIAGIGGGLVVVGATQEIHPWLPDYIEKVMDYASAMLTIFGVLVLTASIYSFEPNPSPPLEYSRTRTAPTVLFLGVCALVSTCFKMPSLLLVNGFAIIGLVGGLFRAFTWIRPTIPDPGAL